MPPQRNLIPDHNLTASPGHMTAIRHCCHPACNLHCNRNPTPKATSMQHGMQPLPQTERARHPALQLRPPTCPQLPATEPTEAANYLRTDHTSRDPTAQRNRVAPAPRRAALDQLECLPNATPIALWPRLLGELYQIPKSQPQYSAGRQDSERQPTP